MFDPSWRALHNFAEWRADFLRAGIAKWAKVVKPAGAPAE
jgi:hypothetical protein